MILRERLQWKENWHHQGNKFNINRWQRSHFWYNLINIISSISRRHTSQWRFWCRICRRRWRYAWFCTWFATLASPTWIRCNFWFNVYLLFYCSPQKDDLESPISDNYLNFALLRLWNLLFNFQIWCRLSLAGLSKIHFLGENFKIQIYCHFETLKK